MAATVASSSTSMTKIHAGNIPTLPQTKRCPMCSAKFTRTTHLNRHLRSHTNERLYHCDICESQFTRSDLLARHKRTCGDPNANRSRRKSCQSCAASKIKCDLQWPCSKCTARGRTCEFINDPRIAREKKAAAAERRRPSLASSDLSESTTTDDSSSCASPPPLSAYPLTTFDGHPHCDDLSCDTTHLRVPIPDGRYYSPQTPDSLYDGFFDPAVASPGLSPTMSASSASSTMSMYSFPDMSDPHCTYNTSPHALSPANAALLDAFQFPAAASAAPQYAGDFASSLPTDAMAAAMYVAPAKPAQHPYVMGPPSPAYGLPSGYGMPAWESSSHHLSSTPNVVITSPSQMWQYA